jgi:hypothetical protein
MVYKITRALILIFLIAGSSISLFSQVEIFGVLKDKDTEAPIAYAQVVLYRYKTTEVAAFAVSDEKGSYQLKLSDNQTVAFTLKTNSLTHENIEKDVYITATQATQRFEVNLALNAKTLSLPGLEVTAKLPPLIVKEDTIIYTTEYWTNNSDQSLEEVLAKIPGFEILSDGEIKVNGKQVNKVLIDGEEVTDGGARLITRNLDPNKVKSVEVRFDEENTKYKRSLLSTNDFVVLDIKLKDDFKKSLFGRAQLNAGVQERIYPGGVMKIFSLTDVKMLVLGEWDEFGDETILISDIKNLGAEEFSKIVSTPADYQQLLENPYFAEEIWGFKEFTRKRVGSLGATGKITISPTLDLFVGSYNNTLLSKAQKEVAQSVITTPNNVFGFEEEQITRLNQSKNKLELRFDKTNLKLRYNINAILADSKPSQTLDADSSFFYKFDRSVQSKEFYQNLFFEYQLKNQNGFHVSVTNNFSFIDADKNLQHSDTDFTDFYDSGNITSLPHRLQQTMESKTQNWTLNGFYSMNLFKQPTSIGVKYLQSYLTGKKAFYSVQDNNREQLLNSSFTAVEQQLQFQQIAPYWETRLSFWGINWSNKLGIAYSRYPQFNTTTTKQKTIFEWDTNANYYFEDKSYIIFSFTRNVAPFPLYQLLPGLEIQSIQTISIPGLFPILPTPQEVISFDTGIFSFVEQGIALDGSYTRGKVLNAPSFSTISSGLFASQYDQLPASYVLLVGKIAKVFDIPLQTKLEVSHDRFNLNNRLNNTETFSTSSKITTFDYRIYTTFKDRNYNLEGRLKLTLFGFESETDFNAPTQYMYSANLKYEQSLIKKQLLLNLNTRFNAFRGESSAALVLMDFSLNYFYRDIRLSLMANNIFDSRSFIVQQITPLLYQAETRAIFQRYFRLGIQFDLN